MKPYYVVGLDGLEGPYDTLEEARYVGRVRGLPVVATLPPEPEPAPYVTAVRGVREVGHGMSATPTQTFPRNAAGGISTHPGACTCGPCDRSRAYDAKPFGVGERVEAPEFAPPGSVATVRGYEVDGLGKVWIEWDHHPGITANYWPCHLRRSSH